MATLKLVIVPTKVLKNGKHKVRIAVSHNQDTRYIVTNVIIDSEKQFKEGQVVGHPDATKYNRDLRNKFNSIYDALDKINPDAYNCTQLKDYLEKNTKSKAFSISQAAEEHINKLKKESTKGVYRRTLDYFIDCVGDVPLEMISPTMIEKFISFLEDKGNCSTTIAINLRQLKAFITPQIKRGNVTYKIRPFTDVSMPESRERVLDITVEEFKMIRDSDYKEKPLRVARDLFCLSYYLAGINLIDLLEIDFRKTKVVEYIREKSRNTKRGEKMISLTIQPEAKEIISRWMGRNGRLEFGYNYSYENFRNYVTKQIQRLADKLGINKRVVYYSARKSVVQHGYDLGVRLEILEYSIGHSNKEKRPIFNYVRIMRGHADEAMRLILDNLKDEQ
ncbi:MAG: site-specific integrase [Bacteroidaceae bacterium]